jgi:hypothetical protein
MNEDRISRGKYIGAVVCGLLENWPIRNGWMGSGYMAMALKMAIMRCAVKGTDYPVTQKNGILIVKVTMVNTVTIITGF